MTAEEIERTYITVPEIMADTGTHRTTVYNWLKYHKHMAYENVLGKPVVRRDEYARFKREHAELVEPQKQAV